MTTKESLAVGNAAKMCEALAGLIDGICFHCDMSGDCKGVPCEKMQNAKAALAAPPRNCDRYDSGDPVKDADDAYAEWQRWCDAADMPPSCKVESAFRQWLFATAKPKAKGESDGSN